MIKLLIGETNAVPTLAYKKEVVGRLEEINASLKDKSIDCMGIKGNKIAKKSIMTSL